MYESRRVAYEELNFSRVELAYPQDFSRTRAPLARICCNAARPGSSDVFIELTVFFLVIMASLAKAFHLTLLVPI